MDPPGKALETDGPHSKGLGLYFEGGLSSSQGMLPSFAHTSSCVVCQGGPRLRHLGAGGAVSPQKRQLPSPAGRCSSHEPGGYRRDCLDALWKDGSGQRGK